MCANRKNPRMPCNREDRGVPESGLGESADVELDVGALQSGEWVEAVAPAPVEPAAQLVGVQRMSPPGVASEVGHRRNLRRRQAVGLPGGRGRRG
jgi:hypothetical protein